jgi:hypothetical protein
LCLALLARIGWGVIVPALAVLGVIILGTLIGTFVDVIYFTRAAKARGRKWWILIRSLYWLALDYCFIAWVWDCLPLQAVTDIRPAGRPIIRPGMRIGSEKEKPRGSGVMIKWETVK